MSDGIGRDEQMDIKDRGRTRRASGQVRGIDAFEAEIDIMSAVTVASQRNYVCEGAEMQCIHRSKPRQSTHPPCTVSQARASQYLY